MNGPRLQNSLGIVTKNSTRKDRTWNNGALALGEVVKVHSKRYTADVRLYDQNYTVMSSASNEGVNSCKICVRNAGYDSVLHKPYGEILPIQKGSIVLVGFIGTGNNRKPVIIGVLHDTKEDVGNINNRNILTSAYPVDDDSEKNRYTNVTRSQDFFTIDGVGNFEIFSHTRSFFAGINSKEIDDETFDYDRLSVRRPDGEVIGLSEKDSKPMKFIGVFRKFFDTMKADNLRFIIDSAKSSFRLAQLQTSGDKLSMFHVDETGKIHLKRQFDTASWNEDSTNHSDIIMENDGSIHVNVAFEGKTTSISITRNGIQLDSNGVITLNSDSDINLQGSVELSGDLHVSGGLSIPQSSVISSDNIKEMLDL